MKELDRAEIESISGGGPWLVAAAVWGVVSGVAVGYNNFKEFSKGFQQGFNEEVAKGKR